MAIVVLSPENVEKAKAQVRKAFEAGANDTIGDNSDMGFLYHILEALDCDFK